MTVELHISYTQKGYHPSEEWTIVHDDSKTFEDMDEAEEFLKERYGTCKRVRMFCDKKNGPPVKCGRIYCYRDADWSHSPVAHWLAQDWVSFYTVKRERIEQPA